MGRSIATLTLTALALAILLQACSSGDRSGRSYEPAAGGPQTLQSRAGQLPEKVTGPAMGTALSLPAPSELAGLLPASRQANFELEDLLKQAEDFEILLPSNRISTDNDSAAFSPDWFPGDSIEGLAYAMYAMSIPDYDAEPVLSYVWKSEPSRAQDVYVAFANWDMHSWNWYQGNQTGQLELASFDPYLTSDGRMLVCFLLTGDSSGSLDHLRIGGPVQVTIMADQVAGVAPCEIALSADAASSEGTITEYLWDVEGDGSFELSSGPTPGLLALYQSGGRFRPVVKAVDNNGNSGEAGTRIAVYDQGIFSFGVEDTSDGAKSNVIGSDGRLLVAGNGRFSFVDELQFCAMDPNGEILFSRRTEGAYSVCDSAVMGSDGFVYVCGGSYGAENQLLLQKWSQDGDLIWTRVWGGGIGGDYFSGIDVLPDGRIVCAGRRYSDTYGGYGGCVLCFNIAGSLEWAKALTEPNADVDLYDLEVFESPGGPEIRVCGSFERGDADAYYAAFDASGTLVSSRIWDCPDIDASPISMASMPNGDVYLACDFSFFGNSLAAVTKVGGGSVQIVDVEGKDLFAEGLRVLGEGRLYLTLERISLSPDIRTPILGTLSSALTVEALQQFGSDGTYLLWDSMTLGENGFVICGKAEDSPPPLASYVPDTGTANLGEWVDFAAGYITPEISLSSQEFTVIDNTADFVAGDEFEGNHMLVFVKP